MSKNRFATAINCMDGRVQLPIFNHIRTTCDVDFVDMVTEPGPIKALSENIERTIVESIKRRVGLSISRHQSELVAIVGHYDCAGNPVDQDTQEKQIRRASDVVESWKFNVQIIGLWVDKNLKVHEVPI